MSILEAYFKKCLKIIKCEQTRNYVYNKTVSAIEIPSSARCNTVYDE
jgi:hypothetical protein